MASYQGKGVWVLTEEDIEAIKRKIKGIIDSTHHEAEDKYRWGESPQRRFQRNLEGYMAEYVVALHYGLVPDLSYYVSRGDDGYDLDIGGKRLGVKSTRYPNGRLLVKEAEKKECEAYMLCISDTEQRTVRIVGWMWAEDVPRNGWKGSLREGGEVCFAVPQYKLNPCRLEPLDYRTEEPDVIRKSTERVPDGPTNGAETRSRGRTPERTL